jgi:undecaprenyl phosphate-alpha-L-ara4N flippase subunit ArnE
MSWAAAAAAAIAMIGLTVAANVLVKLGAAKTAAARPLATLMAPEILLGMGCFGLAFVLYALVLRALPLNVAQSIFAFQFIGAILAAATVLAEPIGPARWFGIALIAAGILIVAWSEASA